MNGHTIRQPFGIAIVLIVGLLALLPGCGGGGSTTPDPDPTPDPLTVSNVFPKDLAAHAGSTVRFIAQTSDPVSSYSWDFKGGATPSTSTLVQPLVVLGPPGVYTGSLTVCAAECSEAFAFTYTVKSDTNPIPDAPRVLSVTPSGTAGPRGTTVTFTANIEGDSDNWHWDFGGGTQIPTSTEQSPSMFLLREGVFTGTFTAGLSSVGSDTFTFSYLVTSGTVQAPPIIDFILNEDIEACDNRKLVFEPEVISDFPITDFTWSFGGGVDLAVSNNSIARVTTQGLDSEYSATLRVSNQFGVSEPRQFTYKVFECPEATVEISPRDEAAQGTTWLDIHSPGRVNGVLAEVVPHGVKVNGPMFVDNFTHTMEVSSKTPGPITGTVRLLRAGSGWAFGDKVPFSVPFSPPGPLPRWNPVLTVPSQFGAGIPPEIALIDGRPALLMIDPVREWLQYASSNIATPNGDEDWQIHDVFELPLKQVGNSMALSPTDGRPLLVLENNLSVLCLMADSPDPTSASDWTITAFDAETYLGGGVYRIHGATLPDGRLLITGDRNMGGPPLVIQSLIAHPVAANDFLISEPWDPALTANQSPRRVIAWNGRWLALIQDSLYSRSVFAAANVDAPLLASDWTIYPLELPDPGRGFVNAELIAVGPKLHLLTDRWNGVSVGVDCFTSSAIPPLAATDWVSLGFLPDIQLSYQSNHFFAALDDRLIALTTIGGRRWFLQRALNNDNIDVAENWWKSLTIDTGNSTINPQTTAGILVVGNRLYWPIMDTGEGPVAEGSLGLRIMTTTQEW